MQNTPQEPLTGKLVKRPRPAFSGAGAEEPTLSDQLRAIINGSGTSRYRVCRAAKVDPSQLHRFMKGKGRLTTDSLDRLARALELRLVANEPAH